MPFDESSPLTINVTSADILAAGTTSTTNSLALAIKRYYENLLLPGQEHDTVSQNCGSVVSISPRIMNGQVVTVCEALVCTRIYSVPVDVTLIIVLETLGIKPSNPYSAVLTHS